MFAPVCWLDKIKQTCNKTYYETKQQYLQQQKYTVISHLIILSHTKTYTSTLVNSFILFGISFQAQMMKNLCCFPVFPLWGYI